MVITVWVSEKNAIENFSKIKIFRIWISLEILGYVHHINISDGSVIREESSEQRRSENPVEEKLLLYYHGSSNIRELHPETYLSF